MSTKTFGGKRYTLEDAFPTKSGANKAAKDLRSYGDLARAYDAGKGSGRLRYLVYSRMKR